MEPELRAALLAGAGVLAGIINTLAGGGSLLTLPALIFSGLPADVANATNRVGVLLQSGVGIATHQRAGKMPWGQAALPLALTAAGALLGAAAATWLGRDGLRPAIGAVLLLALPLVFLDPRRFAGRPRSRWLRGPGLFAAGAYGGFVQAGVGILLLAVLAGLGGLPLPRANALKLLLVGAFTLPALAVFWASDLVAWGPGLALGAGSLVGGTLGSWLNLRGGDRLIRVAVAVMVLASGAKLLWG